MNLHIIDNLLTKAVPEAGAQAEPAADSDGGVALRVVAEQSRLSQNEEQASFDALGKLCLASPPHQRHSRRTSTVGQLKSCF
jgi:hypothetical protein